MRTRTSAYRSIRRLRLAIGLALTGVALAQDNAARVNGLLERLKDSNPNQREYAAKGLAALAPDIAAAVPALAAALADPSMGVRYNAAKALGLVGPAAASAVSALAEALKSNDWCGNAQAQAALALGRIGPAAAAAAPALATMLTSERRAMARQEAARALAAMGPAALSAAPALTAALQDPNGFVQVAAAAALWQVARDERGLPVLIKALADPSLVGTRVAADTLGDIGEGARPALPALVQALRDPSACTRVAAARALWRVGRDPQGVPALVAALDDVATEVRTEAAAALRLMQREAEAPVPGLPKPCRKPRRPSAGCPSGKGPPSRLRGRGLDRPRHRDRQGQGHPQSVEALHQRLALDAQYGPRLARGAEGPDDAGRGRTRAPYPHHRYPQRPL